MLFLRRKGEGGGGMRGTLCILAVVAALGLANAARAQTAPTETAESTTEPAARVDDIIVSGGRLEELTARFVEEATEPPRRRGLARWAGPVCIGVMNFRRDVGEYIADRLVQIGDEVGVPVDASACDPNIYVVGAADAPSLAREWVERHPRDFRPRARQTNGSRSSLDRFVSSDDAVRWWHVSMPMHFDILTGRASRAVALPGEPTPSIQVYAKSQLRSRIRDDLMRVVIIVDVDRLEDATLAQLGDYLAMVAFAQIDPEGDTMDYPTILNLFDGDRGVPGLTEWDRAFLTAMYDAVPDRRLNGVGQGRHLAVALREARELPESESPRP